MFGDQSIFHILKEQFQKKTIGQVLQDEDADFLLNEVRQSLITAKKRSSIREMRFGNIKRYFSGNSVPFSYTVNGKRTVAVIANDITEHRRTEGMLYKAYAFQRRSDFIDDLLSSREPRKIPIISSIN